MKPRKTTRLPVLTASGYFLRKTGKGIQMNPLNTPHLKDKIVLLYLKNRSLDDAVLLREARFDIQADRVFIVGRFCEGATANDWATDVGTAISWDAVEQYLIFDSLEDYFSRASQAMDKNSFH
ncbi:MAG: hypothetical protein ACOC0H_05025 [Thermodesulfobacteriota bacterium]